MSEESFAYCCQRGESLKCGREINVYTQICKADRLERVHSTALYSFLSQDLTLGFSEVHLRERKCVG